VVDPPYRSSALWRRHDGSVARARLARRHHGLSAMPEP
jgi:hypothetical protein